MVAHNRQALRLRIILEITLMVLLTAALVTMNTVGARLTTLGILAALFFLVLYDVGEHRSHYR